MIKNIVAELEPGKDETVSGGIGTDHFSLLISTLMGSDLVVRHSRLDSVLNR